MRCARACCYLVGLASCTLFLESYPKAVDLCKLKLVELLLLCNLYPSMYCKPMLCGCTEWWAEAVSIESKLQSNWLMYELYIYILYIYIYIFLASWHCSSCVWAQWCCQQRKWSHERRISKHGGWLGWAHLKMSQEPHIKIDFSKHILKICETRSHKSPHETHELDQHSSAMSGYAEPILSLSWKDLNGLASMIFQFFQGRWTLRFGWVTTKHPTPLDLWVLHCSFLRWVWAVWVKMLNTLIQDLSEHQTYQTLGEWTFILRKSWTMTVQTLINS